MKKKITLILLIFSIILLGFLRDFVFIQTNLILYNKLHNTSYEVLSPVNLMNNWEYYPVYYMKFILTLLTVFLYWILCYAILIRLFNNSEINMIHTLIFIGVFIISGIIFCVGLLTNEAEKMYNLSRELLGFVQSPLPLMLLIPLGYLLRNNLSKNKS